MPTFSYRGYNAQGQKVGGSLSCANRAQTERQLERLGVVDYELYESKTRFYHQRPYAMATPGELAVFCREAAVVLAADMPHTECLSLLADLMKNEQIKLALLEMSAHNARGYTLAGALGMYEHVFGAFITRVAAAGEVAGRLTAAFSDLADYYEQEAYFYQKRRASLLYPTVRMVFLWLAVYVVIARSLTVFERLFIDMGVARSRLFYAAHALYAFGWIFFLAAAVCAALVYGLARAPRWRRGMDRLLTTLPAFKSITLSLCAGRIARGLALLTAYGIPLNGAEACLRWLACNFAVEDKLITIWKRIQAGQEPATVLESAKNFQPYLPAAFHNMLLLGLTTGKTWEAMAHAGRLMDQEAEAFIDRTGARLEPFLLCWMAVTAALPLLAMLTPLIRVMNALGV